MAAVAEQEKRFTHTAFQVMAYDSYIELAERLKARRSLGYSIIGFVDDHWKGMTAVHKTDLPIVSDLKSFPEYIRNNVVDEVMICLPMKSYYDQTLRIVTACEEQGLKVHFLPAIFDLKLVHTYISI